MASTQASVTSTTTIDYAALYAQEDEGLSDKDKATIIIITLIVASVAIILSLITCFCCKDRHHPKNGGKDDEEDSRSVNGSRHSPGGGGGGDTCSNSGNSPRPLFGVSDAPVGGGSAYTPLYTESPMRFGRTMSTTAGGRRSSLSMTRTPPSRNLSFQGEPTLPAAAPRPARSRRRTSVSIEDHHYNGNSPENLASTKTPRARNGDYTELEGVHIEIPPNADLYQQQLDKLSQHQQCAFGGEGGRGDGDDDDQLFTCAGSDTGDTPTSALSSYENNNNWDSKRGSIKTRFEQTDGVGGGVGDTESTGTITPRQQSSPRIDSSGKPIDRGVRFVDEDLASTGDAAIATTPRNTNPNLYDGVDGVRKCTHCGATFRGAISVCPVAGISHKQLFEEFQRQKKAKREIQRRMRSPSGQHHNTFSEGSQ